MAINTIYDLIDKHLSPYRRSGRDEIRAEICPFCKGGDSEDRYTFSVNTQTGGFYCFRGSCSAKGGIEQLASYFGEQAPRSSFKFNTKSSIQYKLPSTELLPLTPAAIAYFESRHIGTDTLKDFSVSTDKHGNIVFPFILESDPIFVKHRPARSLQKGEPKEWADADTRPILFGMNLCSFDQPLIITEGMIDTLSLYEVGVRNVVSVPSGCENMRWIEECWDWLERFDEIVLFGDNDAPGRQMVNQLTKRLGESRCKIIEEYPVQDGKELKDANEILCKLGDLTLLDTLDSAKDIPMRGLISLSKIVPVDSTSIPRIKTNIPALDKSIGGLREGAVTVFTGRAGEGKLLADDTPVLTRNGWKNHGDLIVGDEVVSDKGEWVKVLHVFPKGVANCKCTFSNGEVIYCHENHEWVLSSHPEIAETHMIAHWLKDGFEVRLIPNTPYHRLGCIFFDKIERCIPRQGNCIMVEGGIYCVGRTMLPTHNSTLSGLLLLNAIEQGYSVCAYSGELTSEEFQQWINLQAAGDDYVTLKYDPVKEMKVPVVPRDVEEAIVDWYDGKFFLYDNQEIFESNQSEAIIQVFTTAVRKYGCKLFLVD